VEDEEFMRSAVYRVLRRRGYDLVLAGDGEEGLAQADRARFDLIILDVLMPGLTGFDVMQRLREHGQADVPVVMLTGRDGDTEILEGYRKGAAYYLTKPFKPERLATVVEYLIGDLSEEERTALEQHL
jgi:DNA-binding response OmpR family regulator